MDVLETEFGQNRINVSILMPVLMKFGYFVSIKSGGGGVFNRGVWGCLLE